ncbi:MAG: DUF4031 domain-containing protein [Solirubrobacteraceae bacterium]|jgi:hypothetical protein
MAVYVDDARIEWRGRRWSHLVANSPDELHRVADALGIPRAAAQTRGRTLHYDLPDEWRDRAIELGLAVPIHWRELVRRRASMAAGGRRVPAPSRPATTSPPARLDSRCRAQENCPS